MEDKTAVGINDIPLLEYTNFFVACKVWDDLGTSDDIATFDLVVREMPEKWSFYIFEGLDRLVEYVTNFRYDANAVQVLKRMGMITTEKEEAYFSNFKFSGDIWAMKNGTVFFPGETIVRVTAPIKEANLLTAFMMNILGYPIRVTTKAVRINLAANGTPVSLISVNRVPSFEASYFQMRAGLLVNGSPGAVPLTYKKFPELTPDPKKVFFNVNHAVIKSFETERMAFNYVFTNLIGKLESAWMMIDTYDYRKGILNYIDEVKKVPGIDQRSLYIGIDSGDLSDMARFVRKMLDKHGLKDIRIQAMSNLEEYKIDKMVRSRVPIDLFTVATEYVNVTDNPRFEVVYKLAELVHPDQSVEYKAKLTKGKESYPGRKQVFRVLNKGKFSHDIIGFEDENLGEPLLQKVIADGKIEVEEQSIAEIRKFINQQLGQLPDKYLDVNRGRKFPVTLSKKLLIETEKIRVKHLK